MQLREVFSFIFPFRIVLPLLFVLCAGLNSYADLGALTLYNRIGFNRCRGPRVPKLQTRIAPNGLRLLCERMKA
jgi:hypothetical protein